MELILETLDDVLPYVTAESGLYHNVKDGYSVVNYGSMLACGFESAVERECRGLKFDESGTLIARPFHKFFNIGEKKPPQDEQWDRPHIVMDKLDGSMIHPAMLRGELVFMTRGGFSREASLAWSHASSEAKDLCRDMVWAGYTPIFEFTAPDNRIVVAYETPQLTLLAVREIRTGAYMPHAGLVDLGDRYGVPVVKTFGQVDEFAAFWARARGLEDVEGYVVAFEDGYRLKFKADGYVLRHRALEGLRFEKNVLAWVATGAVDDVLPLLKPDAADTVRAYHESATRSLTSLEANIQDFVNANRTLSRKEFALKVQAELDKRLHAVAFSALNGKPVRDGLLKLLKWAAHSETRVHTVRDLLNTTWTPIRVGD